MREYECLYIASPALTEEQLQSLSDRVAQVVADNGGEILSVNPWGKRRLAYEIKRHKEGFYFQVRMNAEAPVLTELDQALRYSELAMRHIIVRADDLDPALDSAIPDQLPEPGTDDWEERRAARMRRSAPPVEPEAGEQPEAAADEGAGAGEETGDAPDAGVEVEAKPAEAPAEQTADPEPVEIESPEAEQAAEAEE